MTFDLKQPKRVEGADKIAYSVAAGALPPSQIARKQLELEEASVTRTRQIVLKRASSTLRLQRDITDNGVS